MIERSVDQIEEVGVRCGRMKAVGANDYFPARQCQFETFPRLDYPSEIPPTPEPSHPLIRRFWGSYIRFFRNSRFIIVVGSKFLLTIKLLR
jgi:hypothetical protein